MSTKKDEKNPSKTAEMVTEFGERKINVQNMSRTVVLPKKALENCQCDNNEITSVNVQLVQNNVGKFIRLIPICPTEDKEPKNEKEVKSKNE